MKRAAWVVAAPVFFLVLHAAAAPAPAPAGPGGKLSARLESAFQEPRRIEHVWVFLRDKGPLASLSTAGTRAPLTSRALSRRVRRARGGSFDFADRAVFAPYLDAVRSRVARVRQVSRWFNAVSVEADAAQVRALATLPFVSRLDVVRRYRQGTPEPVGPDVAATVDQARRRAYRLDYGTALRQVDQIGVPAVHDLGFHGEGVMVAVLDAGFNNLPHEAFAGLALVGQYDFVNGDEDVSDGADRGEGSHGTATLSTLGGYAPGQLIGPAFGAFFLLAKTEDSTSETPIEEDNWAAAAEWAEAAGADVISSSLGYLDFDRGFPSYGPQDMNGDMAISTRAADLAAERGVVVVNSAGNAGFNAAHNTLGAPADGHRVLAVGAVDLFGTRTSFSSVGPSADGRIKPDVAAAGASVKTASPRGPRVYQTASGTSFSCPLTAGVVTLILQAHPEYTVGQVAGVLRGTASQAAAPDNLLGWGIVNALAAIQAVPPEP